MRLYAPVGGKKRPAYFVPPKKSFCKSCDSGKLARVSEHPCVLLKCPKTLMCSHAFEIKHNFPSMLLLKCPKSLQIEWVLTNSDKLPAVARLTKAFFWGQNKPAVFFPRTGAYRLIFQHFSRSTSFTILCTAQISKFQKKIVGNFG